MIEPKFKRIPSETWWIERARCIGEEPELFFPVGSTGTALEQTTRRSRSAASVQCAPTASSGRSTPARTPGCGAAWARRSRREERRKRRREAAADALVGVG